MDRFKVAVAAMSVLIVGACGPTTRGLRTDMPKDAVPAERARLVLYQPSLLFGLSEMRVQIDGKGTCGIAGLEAIAWDIAPGQHRLSMFSNATAGTSVLTLDFEAGKTTYVSASRNHKQATATFFAGPWGARATSDESSPHGGAFVLQKEALETGEREIAGLTTAACPFQGITPGSVTRNRAQ